MRVTGQALYFMSQLGATLSAHLLPQFASFRLPRLQSTFTRDTIVQQALTVLCLPALCLPNCVCVPHCEIVVWQHCVVLSALYHALCMRAPSLHALCLHVLQVSGQGVMVVEEPRGLVAL